MTAIATPPAGSANLERDPSESELAPNARNPRALAELVIGHPIDWDQVDEPALLEEALGLPYDELFDPRFGSPIYLGSELDERGELRRADLHVPERTDDVRDSERAENRDGFDPKVVRDLEALLGSFDTAPVRSFRPNGSGGWQIEIGPAASAAESFLVKIRDRGALDIVLDLSLALDGWTPAGAEWKDTGSFFKEAAEYFDPIQGGVGDCGLISALSSVAWTLPYTFEHRSRATGAGNEQFLNQFGFTNLQTGQVEQVEATERILVSTNSGLPLYAKSCEAGETWPALLEKAFAKWMSGTISDRPNISTALNATVWPDLATAQLTGRTAQRTAMSAVTASQLATLVKSHCVNGRTVDPITAWTYASAPAGLSYADANIVGNHAYSVLGWLSGVVLDRAISRFDGTFHGTRVPFVNVRRDYVILRNPWGHTEGTKSAYSGTISLRDIGFTRSLDLASTDGVFAIDFPTFQSHFRSLGIAV